MRSLELAFGEDPFLLSRGVYVFRDREKSTSFMAAIADHRHYLEKKAEAEKMRNIYNNEAHLSRDYSLKPGEKIKINLPSNEASKNRPNSSEAVLFLQTLSEDDWGEFM